MSVVIVIIRYIYHTNFKSTWELHINTQYHITGKRKIRSDKVCQEKCTICDYKTKNNTVLRQHILTKHSTKEERKACFTYYCAHCDVGTFARSIFKNHNKSDKHKLIMEIINNKTIVTTNK